MDPKDKKFLYTLLAGLAVSLVFLYLARRVITPFLIAFALAYLLDPLVDRLERWKLPRTPAVLLLMTVFFTVTLIGAVVLVPLLRVQVEHLAHNLPDYLAIVQGWLQPILDRLAGFDQARIRDVLKLAGEKLGSLPLEVFGSMSGVFWSSLSSLVNLVFVFVNALIIPVAMFYLLRDFDGIVARVGALVPPRFRESSASLFREIDQVLSQFVRGQLMVATLMAIMYCVGLYLCGTPMSLFIGIVAGYANLIPYLGLVFGLIPALLLTFLQYQEWTPLLGVVAVFAVVQGLEGMIITPRVVGDKLGLHPVAVMLAVLVGAELLGILGILIAVPVAAVLNVLMRRGVAYYKKSAAYA